ncbi:hypothetical protein GIB67_023907 [Kingdonia uniflora]|uniref:Uncharacterized protein n=1 Tax=Kingdonia uniflora TaxID=39325 RepID=A0A7J7NGA9_9MAGN|nr:hypothetical protein GIB67_023907 [Kingdonia uniflora]
MSYEPRDSFRFEERRERTKKKGVAEEERDDVNEEVDSDSMVLDSEDNMHDANEMDSLDDDEHNSRDDYDVKDDIVKISSKQQAREVPSSPTDFATSNYNMDMRHIQLHYGYASHFSLCMGPSKVDYDDQTPKDLIRLRCCDSRNS